MIKISTQASIKKELGKVGSRMIAQDWKGEVIWIKACSINEIMLLQAVLLGVKMVIAQELNNVCFESDCL